MKFQFLKRVAITLLFFGCAASLRSQTLNAQIDSSHYGWMDQYSMNAEHDYVGNEACVPTSSTNGMTLLQNLYPAIFGTALSGTTYADWHATDNTLIGLYGTQPNPNGGTTDPQFVNAIYDYIVTTNNFTQTTWAGLFPSNDGWDTQYPAPGFVTFGKPTAQFLYDAIASNSMLMLGLDYCDAEGQLTGGGHELLANGITWDFSTSTGTISFIDPLDPSQSYGSDGVVDGPALQTNGTISLLEDGRLLLYYNQYNVTGIVENPGPSDFTPYYLRIDEALAIGVVPEPSTIALMGMGLLSLLALKQRRQK